MKKTAAAKKYESPPGVEADEQTLAAIRMELGKSEPDSRASRYSHIDFAPPAGVRKEAAKGLAWRREHGRGGTAVGVARARDLSNGTKISPETARRMKAFFDRHQVNKGKTGWSPGEEKFPSNARIAWALWGSDAGWSWSKKLVTQMNAADEAAKRQLRSFLSRRKVGG